MKVLRLRVKARVVKCFGDEFSVDGGHRRSGNGQQSSSP